MSTHLRLSSMLGDGAFTPGPDGIFSAPMDSRAADQQAEIELRERVAAQRYGDYLAVISRHHSVPVMDHEVDRFLALMPAGAAILDIGGCRGWHWRRLATTRPDVGVLIIDFVRANLLHAQRVLGPLVGSQVALMHADATSLPFPDAGASSSGFDGIWTVQALQHIPDFARACREAGRVLRPGGRFINYSQHATPLNRAVYRLLGKTFHLDGRLQNSFHHTRASDSQRRIVAEAIGGGRAEPDRYTECLFNPDLRLFSSGRPGSMLGHLDAKLGELPGLGRWIANQRSFEAVKA